MASLSRHRKNTWLIQFISPMTNRRTSFYPGEMDKRCAEAFRGNVQHLISAKRQGTSPSDETSNWVGRQSVGTREKLYAHGLIAKPVEAAPTALPTLTESIDGYLLRHATAKPATLTVWRRCRALLLAYFPANVTMQEIVLADAQDWRAWMLREGNLRIPKKPKPLGENTVRKMCSVASQFFAEAVERGETAHNPFAHKSLPRTTKENRSRDQFISREIIDAVIEAAPDVEWKLLIALSRYGGLRCPSETLSLKWTDILWDSDRIRVPSPKTEHHEGKGERTIPIFPELRPFLDVAFHAAPDGAVYCIHRYRGLGKNLRSQFTRIIAAAGQKPWEKLFHNLRASRETELVEEYPIQTVCAWIGNSPAVAARHYLTVPAEHFARAAISTARITPTRPATSRAPSRPSSPESV